jgi:hypothetical protein
MTVDEDPKPQQDDFVLALLRTAAARARLMAIDVDAIGSALSHKIITAETAIAMLHEAGAAQMAITTTIKIGGSSE